MSALRRSRLARLSVWLSAAALLAVSSPLLLTGCESGPGGPTGAQGPSSDEELIQAQGACPVTGKKLGSMGKPVKVMVNGQPVFLCCDACEDEALADPEKTLAKVKELQEGAK